MHRSRVANVVLSSRLVPPLPATRPQRTVKTPTAAMPIPVTHTARSHAPSSHANSAQPRPGSATPLRQPRPFQSRQQRAATPRLSHAPTAATHLRQPRPHGCHAPTQQPRLRLRHAPHRVRLLIAGHHADGLRAGAALVVDGALDRLVDRPAVRRHLASQSAVHLQPATAFSSAQQQGARPGIAVVFLATTLLTQRAPNRK